MLFRQFILFFVAVLGLSILYQTEFITKWLDVHLLNPPISDQFDHTSIEDRKAMRYGATYKICQVMVKTLEDKKINKDSAYVLLPPNDYLKANKSAMHLPEPAEFYYHCGIRTLWTTSPDVEKANWALVAVGTDGVNFIPITDKVMLHQLLDMYKNYKPAL